MNVEDKIKEFFHYMGWEAKVESRQEDTTIFVDVWVDEPRPLIGNRGIALHSLQRILRVILIKEFKKEVFLDLDVNNYKKRKTEYLQEVAKEMADEAVLSQEAKVLPAMNAYERRIVHIELSSRGDVITQGQGEEPNRCVVVKPV